MKLDREFVFSQQSLADFEDCPRRFYLAYVLRQPWPQLEPAPQEFDVPRYREFLRKGAALHRWIERRWLGLPAMDDVDAPGVAELVADPEFALWWQRFESEDFSELPAARAPELELLAPLGEFTLAARLDLLAVDAESGRAVVVDWKTMRGEHAMRPEFLRRRVQTRAYLYALATAGGPYRGGVRGPQGCEFHYWMASAPGNRWVRFVYDQGAYERDRAYLSALSADAAARDGEAEFGMTDDERKCAMCTYRTLCRRTAVRVEPHEWIDDERAPEMESTAALEY